jgi:hypothetical protein
MSAFDQSILTQFTGTEHYYRLNRKCVLTDGTKYLAETAEAYWLLDVAASYLLGLGSADWFVLIRLKVKDYAALLTLEDGNGQISGTANPASTRLTASMIWLSVNFDFLM